MFRRITLGLVAVGIALGAAAVPANATTVAPAGPPFCCSA